jgi:hypothetical protein
MASSTTLESLWQAHRKATPGIEFQHVEVTFPSTANQDVLIPTLLRPVDPEGILYRIVDMKMLSAPAAAPCIYRDTSTTRRAWGTGFIVLRCNVANVVVTLELFVKREQGQ